MFIEQIPKALLEDITTSRCVPFIGAGFSKNADCKIGMAVPDWDGLGRIVASYLNDYEYDGAIESLSSYEEEYSRSKLIEVMAKELHINEVKPGNVHLSFCKLYFDIICTTNFDFLLEKAYESLYSLNGKPYLTITNENRLSTYMNEKATIIKLHGDFNDPQKMVVTERDYDLFINNNPIFATYIANLLITRTPLLIGYSFNDPDIRMLWSIISSRLGNLRRRGYAFMVDASSHEVSRFMRRGIKVINIKGKKSDYQNILETLFKELLEYWDKINVKAVSTTNEDAVGAIKFSDDDKSQLCFFSVPINKLSLYKKYVFPIVINHGLTPVSLDEFILPGDNWIAKSEAVIRKVSLAIVDISDSNQNVLMELGMLRERNKYVIGVCSTQDDKLLDAHDINYVTGDFNKNMDSLLEGIDDFLIKFTSNKENDIFNEPKRLLDKKEYNASILAAIKLLELELRTYGIPDTKIGIKPVFNIRLSDMIHNVNVNFNLQLDMARIKEWISIRNQIAHTQYSATKKIAQEIVDGIYKIISDFHDKI